MDAQGKMRSAGIVLILGGVLALLAPLAVSLAITLIVGITFVLGGLFNAWAALQHAEHRFAHGIFAALSLFLGLTFLVDPLGGVLSLTVLVGIVFLLSGAVRLGLAWTRREHPAFWLLLLSGALSVLLGGIVLGDLGGATGILGILLGIELLFAGFGLVALSRMGP